MCCFAQAILKVSDTFIFGRLTDTGTQFLAYEMKYESETPNAMILPLPVETPAQEDSVRFIDLSGYEEFFGDLAKAFPYIPNRSIGCAMMPTDSMSKSALEIHQVGNFVASFVPTVDDFDRLDKQFMIHKETWSKIPEYSNYGFAVFQLNDLIGKPHPMAFEFRTRSNQIFFPTVHIHDGEVHTHEEFDHQLFMQHAGFDSVVGKYDGPHRTDSSTGAVRSNDVANMCCNCEKSKGLIAPDLLVHRVSLNGNLPNKDTTFYSSGSPTVPSFNYRRLLSYWPIAIPLAAIGWIFNRRNKVRSSRLAAESKPLENANAD